MTLGKYRIAGRLLVTAAAFTIGTSAATMLCMVAAGASAASTTIAGLIGSITAALVHACALRGEMALISRALTQECVRETLARCRAHQLGPNMFANVLESIDLGAIQQVALRRAAERTSSMRPWLVVDPAAELGLKSEAV